MPCKRSNNISAGYILLQNRHKIVKIITCWPSAKNRFSKLVHDLLPHPSVFTHNKAPHTETLGITHPAKEGIDLLRETTETTPKTKITISCTNNNFKNRK